MCCKLLRIEALAKPASRWCDHCDVGQGCKIYPDRPDECRAFECGYVTQAQIGEHWRPATSKMVIALTGDGQQLTIFVDPARRQAWRAEPFFSDIRKWAAAAQKRNSRVAISCDGEVIVVEPEREVSLGPVGDDQVIISRRGGAAGAREYFVLGRDDPVLDALRALQGQAGEGGSAQKDVAEARRRVDAWLAQRTGKR